jgi:hypothetical protein
VPSVKSELCWRLANPDSGCQPLQDNLLVAFVLLGIGQTFLNMNWSVAVDMTL